MIIPKMKIDASTFTYDNWMGGALNFKDLDKALYTG
jgi:hypothetical protein